RPLWMALAVADAVILAYVAMRFPWDAPAGKVGETPAGWIVQAGLLVFSIGAKAFAAGIMAAIGYVIVPDPRGPGNAGARGTGLLIFLAFMFAATLIVLAGSREFLGAFDERVMRFGDRLLVFDRLTDAHTPGESIGAYVVTLAFAAYLVEKYALRWINVRQAV